MSLYVDAARPKPGKHDDGSHEHCRLCQWRMARIDATPLPPWLDAAIVGLLAAGVALFGVYLIVFH